MKKLFSMLLAAVMLMAVFAFAACAQDDNNPPLNTPESITVIVPNGSPAISIAKLISEKSEINGVKVNYEVVEGAAIIKTRLLSGEADIAIAPTNLIAQIYNDAGNTGTIKLLSVNVHGALYVVGRNEISDLSELKGKIVYSIGENATPGITFKYILTQSGIPFEENVEDAVEGKVGIVYKNAASDILPLLIKGDYEYAILGEPAVTQTINATATSDAPLMVSVDIQAQWKEAADADYDGIPQAAMVAKSSLTESSPALIAAIMEELEDNAVWVKNNLAKAKTAIEGAGGTLPALTAATVDRSNIILVKADAAKAALESYYNVLKSFNPALIGGKLPDAGFYYTAATAS